MGGDGRVLGNGVVAVVGVAALSTVWIAAAAGTTAQDPELPPTTAPAEHAVVTLSDAQLERMLERLQAGEATPLLNLDSYIVVVGRAPEVPLFGAGVDLGADAARAGASIHSEMMAVMTPSYLRQAAGSDAAGQATAAFVPAAVNAVAGWLGGRDVDDAAAPRFAGYTRTLQLGTGRDVVSSMPFYQAANQPVVVSMRFAEPRPGGVEIVIDGQTLGVFDDSVDDVAVPAEVLERGRPGDVHVLEVAPAGQSPGERADLDVAVVVYSAD